MNSPSSPTTHPDKPTKVTSQAAGYLLNWPGLLAMACILVLAAWNGQAGPYRRAYQPYSVATHRSSCHDLSVDSGILPLYHA